MLSASGQGVTTCASESSVMVGGWFCSGVGVGAVFCPTLCDACEDVKTKAARAVINTPRMTAGRKRERMSDSFAFRLAETGAQVKPKPHAPTTVFLHSFKTPNPAPFPPAPPKLTPAPPPDSRTAPPKTPLSRARDNITD